MKRRGSKTFVADVCVAVDPQTMIDFDLLRAAVPAAAVRSPSQKGAAALRDAIASLAAHLDGAPPAEQPNVATIRVAVEARTLAELERIEAAIGGSRSEALRRAIRFEAERLKRRKP